MFKVEAAMLKVDLALLRCPITLSIMSDPVTASDGNTYERTAITEWRKKSACSPLTNETMSSTKLFPNRAIKNIIDIYLAEEKKAAAGAGAAAVQGSDISASTQPDARVVLLKKLKEKTEERARLAREAGEKAEAARLIYDEAKKEFQDLKQLTLSDDESDTDDRIQV